MGSEHSLSRAVPPPWVTPILLLVALLTYQIFIPCVTVHASSRPLRHPTRPQHLSSRYIIPKEGATAYQKIPYWEALYFLKYGLIPPKQNRFNQADIGRVLDFNEIINQSIHNLRTTSDEDAPRSIGDGPTYISDDVWNVLERKLVGSGLIFRDGRWHYDNSGVNKEGSHPEKGDSDPSYSALLSQLGSLGDNAFQVVDLDPSIVEPPPPPISNTNNYVVPLSHGLARPNLPLQARFGFNRKPRDDPPSPQLNATTAEEVSDDDDEEESSKNAEDERNNKDKRGNPYSYRSPNYLQLKEGGFNQGEYDEESFEPQGTFGYISTHQTSRKDRTKEPFHVLRKFLLDHDPKFFAHGTIVANESAKHSPSVSHNGPNDNGSGFMSKVFLTNLVSRSGGPPDDRGSQQAGTGGVSRGVKIDQTKFQTQGW